MFDIGLALPVIVVLFLLTAFGLNRLLYRPMQAVLAERERRSTGLLHGSEKTLQHYEELFERYRQAVRAAQLEGYKAQDASSAETAQERSRRLAEARQTAETALEQMKESIARQVAESKEQVRKDADKLSEDIAALVLQKTA